MIQEKVVEKIKVVTKDIWGVILDFLDLDTLVNSGD